MHYLSKQKNEGQTETKVLIDILFDAVLYPLILKADGALTSVGFLCGLISGNKVIFLQSH